MIVAKPVPMRKPQLVPKRILGLLVGIVLVRLYELIPEQGSMPVLTQ